MNWVVGGLLALALLWLTALLQPPIDSDLIVGVAVLETLAVVPLVVAVVHRRRVKQRLKATDESAQQEMDVLAAEVRSADEELWRLGNLVAQLDDGAAGDAARSALDAAESATEVRRQLVQRRHELVRLLDAVTSRQPREALQQSIAACEEDLTTVEERFHELGASVADLVDCAGEQSLQQELARIVEATERANAVALAMKEVESIDQRHAIESTQLPRSRSGTEHRGP